MPFIFAYGFLNNRDKRPQNSSVSSDKLVKLQLGGDQHNSNRYS